MVFSNIWFTSDLHFWHKNIIAHCNRPWATPEEMNEGLIENRNSCVGSNDLVVILGDMFFCGTNKAKEIMKRLNGAKHLVRGNHDWGVIKPHRAEEFGFYKVTDGVETGALGGTPVALCHFPYAGDHTTLERYKDKRPVDAGLWLLHGHVHSLWKINGRQINVGVDVWNWKPVHAGQLEEIIHGRRKTEA